MTCDHQSLGIGVIHPAHKLDFARVKWVEKLLSLHPSIPSACDHKDVPGLMLVLFSHYRHCIPHLNGWLGRRRQTTRTRPSSLQLVVPECLIIQGEIGP